MQGTWSSSLPLSGLNSWRIVDITVLIDTFFHSQQAQQNNISMPTGSMTLKGMIKKIWNAGYVLGHYPK